MTEQVNEEQLLMGEAEAVNPSRTPRPLKFEPVLSLTSLRRSMTEKIHFLAGIWGRAPILSQKWPGAYGPLLKITMA